MLLRSSQLLCVSPRSTLHATTLYSLIDCATLRCPVRRRLPINTRSRRRREPDPLPAGLRVATSPGDRLTVGGRRWTCTRRDASRVPSADALFPAAAASEVCQTVGRCVLLVDLTARSGNQECIELTHIAVLDVLSIVHLSIDVAHEVFSYYLRLLFIVIPLLLFFTYIHK